MSDLEQAASELEQAATEEATIPEGTVSEEPFLSFKTKDGQEFSWKSKEDAQRDWEQGAYRHSDYTRKTQELAEQRKEMDSLRQQIAEQQQAIEAAKKKYDPYDEFFKTPRGQQVYQQLEKSVNRVSPNDVMEQSKYYVDEKVSSQTKELQERLEALEKEREQERLSRERNEAFEALASEYEDFDRDAVESEMKKLDELSSLSQDQITKEYLRLIHHALRGRTSAANLEQKFADKQTKKPPISSKGAKKKVPEETGDSLGEAENLAAKELEAML